MLCTLSGEVATVPVVNRKNGNVYEKKLIEAHLGVHDKDPITGEETSVDDLIALKTENSTKPRPPTLTSIPALLATFQNEWDANALESFHLRQQLLQTRQELSNALYENDAAKRIVARMQRERDEAREALTKVSVLSSGSTGERMETDSIQIDECSLNTKLTEVVSRSQEDLSKTRRKRPVPTGWSRVSDIQAFVPAQESTALAPKAQSSALNISDGLLIIGGSAESTLIYSVVDNKLLDHAAKNISATAAVWIEKQVILGTTNGELKIFGDGHERHSHRYHSNKITDLTSHPSKQILASVSIDKSFIFYDVEDSFNPVMRVRTESALLRAQFHPDGHLFATGTQIHGVKLWDTKTGVNIANFDDVLAIQAMSFSENGTWLGINGVNSKVVSIWDLRKSAKIVELEMDGDIQTLAWDYTGQFLVAGGNKGLTVKFYDKSKKEWVQALSSTIPAKFIAWGKNAQSLVALNDEGKVTILASTPKV